MSFKGCHNGHTYITASIIGHVFALNSNKALISYSRIQQTGCMFNDQLFLPPHLISHR
jgi:hypothetical protein